MASTIDPQNVNIQNIQKALDQVATISRTTGYGNLATAITNSFRGINFRGVGNPVPLNTDQHGFTFFTRPCLNLSYDNISSDRRFTPLLTGLQNSLQRVIRCYLDPRAAFENNIVTPIVDNNLPFIPILSNNLISMAGWPDVTMESYTSKSGVQNEAYSMVDGTSRIYNTWDTTCNFRNLKGDPITLLFMIWVYYSSKVYMGEFTPYPDMIMENEIDYMTRIYRFTLDQSRQFVSKVATTVAYPTVVPIGASFNFSEDHPFVRDIDQLSIQFRCIGAEYNDPICIYEFNSLVEMFQPSMTDGTRLSQFKKLSLTERSFFNYNGYPWIDPDTNEFQIWLPMDQYTAAMDSNFTGDPGNIPSNLNSVYNQGSNLLNTGTNSVKDMIQKL